MTRFRERIALIGPLLGLAALVVFAIEAYRVASHDGNYLIPLGLALLTAAMLVDS